jgi:hypothetical protein
MRPLHCLALVLALPGSVSAGVLVVDPLVGPYFDIATAVASAAEGDIVLVKTGTYPGFTITGKGLGVFADVNATVQVTSQVHVTGVTAGKTVVLSRLEISSPNQGFDTAALIASNVTGRLRIQACEITGAFGAPYLPGTCEPSGNTAGWDAVRLFSCADVAISFSYLRGGDSSHGPMIECLFGGGGDEGGDALEASFSSVSVYESSLVAGRGGWGFCQGGNGGDGVRLMGISQLFASNVQASGGPGGSSGEFYICSQGGSGGFGLHLDGPTTSAHLLACTFTGGPKGFGTPYQCCLTACGSPSGCGDGASGQPVFGGTAVNLPGASRALGVPKVLREGQSAILQFSGLPGETAILLLSPAAGSKLSLSLGGVLLLGNPLLGPYFVGTVPASGPLSIPILVPQLPATVQGVVLHMQGALDSPSALPTLTNGAVVAVIDSSY